MSWQNIRSFLEYCYMIVFVHNILCIPGCFLHPSPITLILIFMSSVLSTGNTGIKFWSYIGNMTFVSRIFDSYRFVECSPFSFVNPLKYHPVQFSSLFFCFTWQHLHSFLMLFISSR